MVAGSLVFVSSASSKYVIVEVKADNQIKDAVVQAKKQFAEQIAVALWVFEGYHVFVVFRKLASSNRFRLCAQAVFLPLLTPQDSISPKPANQTRPAQNQLLSSDQPVTASSGSDVRRCCP